MRYSLKDVNPYLYNCGHYPEYVVIEDQNEKYSTIEESEKVAREKNERSSEAWSSFMRG